MADPQQGEEREGGGDGCSLTEQVCPLVPWFCACWALDGASFPGLCGSLIGYSSLGSCGARCYISYVLEEETGSLGYPGLPTVTYYPAQPS